MGKLEEAKGILKELGLPPAQQNDIAAYTLIALCSLTEDMQWKQATATSKTITKGLMYFVRDHYDREYKPNTRETFRRQVLHQFLQAHLVLYNPDKPALPTNSPQVYYKLTDEALQVVRKFGSRSFKKAVMDFLGAQGRLVDRYSSIRHLESVPLKLSDGRLFKLSPGIHNQMQVAVINDFAPKFAQDTVLLYLGDTADKNLIVDKERLKKLNVRFDHDKLPDIVLYNEHKKWLYLIEVVTSHGPISPKRMIELELMFSMKDVAVIYVSVFANMAEFRKHIKNIAWETEVWLAEIPDHLIHFNGDKFLGPRKKVKI